MANTATAAQVRTANPIGHLWGLDCSRLAVQARNCLEREGLRTVADLLKLDALELTDLRNFGPGCLAEVRRVLGSHGLALKGEEVASQ